MKIYSKCMSTFAVLVLSLCLFTLPAVARTCSACNGSGVSRFGKISTPSYTGDTIREYCSTCGGVYSSHTHKLCHICNGSGQIRDTESYSSSPSTYGTNNTGYNFNTPAVRFFTPEERIYIFRTMGYYGYTTDLMVRPLTAKEMYIVQCYLSGVRY